ncbi:MAG: O-antigen ligase [Acidimicrobiales bacterium]
MTALVLAPESTPAGQRARRVVALTQPGITEKAMVVLTAFVFVHEIPSSWLRNRGALESDYSNPLLVAVELALIAIAFARVAGSIDHLVTMVRTEPLVYGYATLTFASTFWSADPSLTLRRATIFVAVTLYGSYLVMRFSLDQILRLLAVMALLSLVINLLFVFALPQYGVDAAGNWQGVFIQKNSLGYVATLSIPTLLVSARTYPVLRWVFYAGAAGHVALLLGSQSKTMLMATLVTLASMVVYKAFRGRKTLRGAVILSLVGSSTFAVAFATANIALLARWLNKDITLTGRVPLWENLIPIALQKPFLGHGFGATFNGFFSPVHEVWIQNRWNPSHAHNALLQIWLEIGIFGVLLYLAVYLRSIRNATRIVAIVPGPVGLWPLTFFTTVLMMSITETGVGSEPLGWMMFMVAVLSTSLHLRHRSSLGLSNDIRAAVSGGSAGAVRP